MKASEATLDNLISQEYRDLQANYHAECDNWGTSGHHWARDAEIFIIKHSLMSILDYGCGKNTLMLELSKKFGNKQLRSYDPCIPGLDDMPQAAEGVLCTDVLEHIEPDKIEAVVHHIASLTRKAAFLVIATQKASHILPDGRNAHLIVKGPSFWIPLLQKHFHSVEVQSGPAGELICEVTR